MTMKTKGAMTDKLASALLKQMQLRVEAYKWFDLEASKEASLAQCVAISNIILEAHYDEADW